MDLKKVISQFKRDLIHESHGGEIFDNELLDKKKLILDFSTNINPLPYPENLKRLLEKSMVQLSKYPDSKSTQLKKELVNYFNNYIKEKNIIISAGSVELISIFADTILEPKDEVIISKPTFSEYEWAVRKNGGKIVNIYRRPLDDFSINSNLIIEQITQKTKIIFLCNPNNPNGLLDKAKAIEKIIDFANEKDIFVFLDEAFIEYAGESNSFVSNMNSYENLFISRTFTKFFGLPGLRVGFGISSPKIIKIISSGQNLWSVNCIGQTLAKELLKSKEFIQQSLNLYSNESKFIKNELEKIPNIKIFPSNANFFLINTEESGIRAPDIKETLLKDNILIRDCSNYDGLNEYYFRISIKTRELNKILLNKLRKIFSSN